MLVRTTSMPRVEVTATKASDTVSTSAASLQRRKCICCI
jgi:hypothetical protein